MKPILSILAIVLCLEIATSGFANDNFFFDFKKAEGIKLLAGAGNIAMLFASNSVLTDNLREKFF